jgi:hypothetical protein
MSALRNFVHD